MVPGPGPDGRRRVGRASAAALACGWLIAACGGGARELTVLSPTLPERFDPHADTRLVSRSVFLNVLEPLVQVDAGGRLVPALAESWTNPTASAYAFRLRGGVRFHDGAPLTAAEVVRSLQASRAPASVLAGNLADVRDVRALDDATVWIETGRPSPLLVQSLTAVPIWRSLPGGLPAGTGPYRLVEFVPGERVRLRAEDRHYRRAPFVREVTFRRFRSAAEAVSALAGDASIVVLVPPGEAVEAAEANPRFRVHVQPANSVVYLAFDVARDRTPGVALPANPFRDVRVRRAIRLALDLDALAAGMTRAGARPATQLVPRTVFGFVPGLAVPRPDPGAARVLLREAGLPEGFAVRLDVQQGGSPLGEAIARQLAPVGVRVQVTPFPPADFRKRIEGGSTFFLYNWVVGLEAGWALRAFLHTRDEGTAAGLRNLTGYSNPEVDRALDEALSTLEEPARLLLLQRAMVLLMEDLPWVPLVTPNVLRIEPQALAFPARTDELLLVGEATPAKTP